jgi:hypothetical protein
MQGKGVQRRSLSTARVAAADPGRAVPQWRSPCPRPVRNQGKGSLTLCEEEIGRLYISSQHGALQCHATSGPRQRYRRNPFSTYSIGIEYSPTRPSLHQSKGFVQRRLAKCMHVAKTTVGEAHLVHSKVYASSPCIRTHCQYAQIPSRKERSMARTTEVSP